ncbi:MAG: DNA repair protein RecN [Methylotenera sp.]|uniref:DNA repair protein RecN n=1 Tax=Methylotenera sp. TaxID=2051956 RepID=UPI0027163781|nr:DNA repair protein RecN [Methylotenera sp.]MDO9150125.1 DNA repair protein RecN [Methylotenera sp.]
MLQTLSIRDFVIVDKLDLDFQSGFTVLTGETGAGKSILIDALSLALGARGEGGVTRVGCDKAEISASFSLQDNDEASTWLAGQEIAHDEPELLLRRVIYADGRSRAFINGISATMQQLKELGEFLVDIYSQNAHHSLLKPATQRQILDEFGGLLDVAKNVAEHYKLWLRLHMARLALEKNAEAYADELALLRDNVRELTALAFNVEEWEALQQEHVLLSNGASLITSGESCVELLSEGELSALNLLAQVQHHLQSMQTYDTSLAEVSESLDSGVIQLQEASRSLNRYIQRMELDPARLSEVDARIQSVHSAARKYRSRVEDLPALLESWQARVAELSSFTDDGALAEQEAAAFDAYKKLAEHLSEGRKNAALILHQKITAEMQRLSLSGGQFLVELAPIESSVNGLEQVEFLVAGHAGVAPRSLSKVASGGELSRISLAIRVVTAQQGSVPTMIFDEVDVGIGGGVAEVVGNLLKQLGEQRQALVITHLPQVASLGKHHLRVSKSQVNGQTLSTIAALDAADRIEEIARMLGGIEITETTREHAKEMLLR